MSWFMLIEITATFAEYFIAYVFFKEFLGVKHKKPLIVFAGGILYVIINAISREYVPYGALSFIVGALPFIFIPIMFKKNIRIKLFAIVLVIILLLTADMLSFFGIMLASNAAPYTILDLGMLTIVGFVISKIIFFLLTKVVCNFRRKDNTHLSFLYWLALITIPIISSVAVFIILYLSYRVNDTAMSILSFISAIGLLYINILAFQLFEFFLEKHKIEMDRAQSEAREMALLKQVETQVAQYEHLENEQASKRAFFHDLHNDFELLHNLVKDGNIDEALEIIDKRSKSSVIKKDRMHTGNAVIDALFNAKHTCAEDRGIKVKITSMHCPKNISMDITDMIVLFGNSWDNAIEACLRITEGEKYINAGLVYRNNRLVYTITNPTNGKLIKDKDKFKTVKTDAGVHGLGIENMEKVTGKYKGVLSLKHHNNTFALTAVILKK